LDEGLDVLPFQSAKGATGAGCGVRLAVWGFSPPLISFNLLKIFNYPQHR